MCFSLSSALSLSKKLLKNFQNTRGNKKILLYLCALKKILRNGRNKSNQRGSALCRQCGGNHPESQLRDTELKMYTDRKYIKTAGDILWKGCLIALDAVLQVRKGKGRPSIEKYKEAASKRDKKLLAYIVNGYDTLHLVMGYDGNTDKRVCDAGFAQANTIIDRCALLCPKTKCA